MAALIAFYSRAGENYFGGAYRRISVGNTEKVAEMLANSIKSSRPSRIRMTTRPVWRRRARTGRKMPVPQC